MARLAAALCVVAMLSLLSARVAIAGDATIAVLEWGKPGCKVRALAVGRCVCVRARQMAFASGVAEPSDARLQQAIRPRQRRVGQ